MDEALFNLRFTEKQLARMAAKAEKEQKIQQGKVKKALQQRNVEGAKIYAENAIRKKNEGLSYLRMAARINAVSARVQTAITMKHVVKDIQSVSKGLDKAMASMDLSKVEGIMSKFEKQFEDLDVRTSTLENSMGAAVTLSTPQNEVDALIMQVAEESGLEVIDALKDLNPASQSIRQESVAASSKEDDLSKRLQQLRN